MTAKIMLKDITRLNKQFVWTTKIRDSGESFEIQFKTDETGAGVYYKTPNQTKTSIPFEMEEQLNKQNEWKELKSPSQGFCLNLNSIPLWEAKDYSLRIAAKYWEYMIYG